ncbi:MAG: hypothetical protein CO136_00220 [Candidatus Levybacteria bacterium CG_4_9_14_3_um_filter_36_7]|nr:MAG: hypothetical protein CO136_00220 [Candidatus Levybacteria bacterium CG_4_9_14_3_um_filter_36_7]
MEEKKLNHYSEFLVKEFCKKTVFNSEKGMTVNTIVSEIAAWYEKLRNAIEYRDEEVILRAAIERILKRRLISSGNGEKVATPLIRELIWARYFPDGSIEEKTITDVAKTINLYLSLKNQVVKQHKIKEAVMTTWMFQLMSSHLEDILNLNQGKETMVNYIYHLIKDNITITDDTQVVRDAQVYISIKKAYAKNDIALLRYSLFVQYFGKLTDESLPTVTQNFWQGYTEIETQLNYPLRHKIFTYVKRQIPPFLIFEDILRIQKENIYDLLKNDEEFKNSIFKTCQKHYNGISAKVRRAVIRSFIFVLLSKVFVAFAIEGTYENLFYGRIMWGSISLNIIIPSFLMVAVGLFIRTPGKENSERIFSRIQTLLFDPNPKIGRNIILRKTPQNNQPFLTSVFNFSWFATFILSFGLVIYVLTRLNFTFVSQIIFVFFLAIVSFLAYRINQTAKLYTVEDKQNILSPIIDFFFMPIARVGRYLTEGISQINIFLFILDFVIETPFKGIVSFFDQWFFFLHSKREDLG